MPPGTSWQLGLCLLSLGLLPACSAAGSPTTSSQSAGGPSTNGAGGEAGSTGDPGAVDPGAPADPGAVDDSGSAGAPGDPGTGPTAPPRRCLARGSQVALIGDSYINWISHTFPSDLNSEARQVFRMYAVGGYAMGSGGIGLIPPEFDQAVAADPDITTVVLDGGGNDILVSDAAQFPQGASCKNDPNSPNIPECQHIVDKAIAGADKLMDRMIQAGVRDVVYFFYPHVPEGTLIGGLHPNPILDYALPRVKAFCDGAQTKSAGKLTCHFVDMIPVFKDHLDWFALTDIHPNSLGSAAMAKAVWATMKSACIAQPASSGCCTP